jgi:lambda family phage portal protein
MPRRRTTGDHSIAENFEGLRSDYNATKASRFRRRRTGYQSLGSGADYHYRNESDYLRLIEQARDMDRNDCVVSQMVDRVVDNILPSEITPKPDTGDGDLDRLLSKKWKEYSCNPELCDVRGEQDVHGMARTNLRASIVDGDMFTNITDGGALELIEAHRCRTPRNTTKNVVHGVKIDSVGRPLEYWFTKRSLDPSNPLAKVSDVTQMPVRDGDGERLLLHYYEPKRVSQTRGITAFAPIFDLLSQFEDINFAKIVQQQVVSCISIIRTQAITQDSPLDPDATGPTETDRDGRKLQGLQPGMEIIGRPGEDIKGFSPQVPNETYFQHAREILRLISINLGLPVNVMLLDASDTNFSGWRGSFEQAKIGFRRYQRNLVARYYRPVYRQRVREWMASDPQIQAAANREGVDIYRCGWTPPTWPYIQPLQDAQADALKLEKSLISPRRLLAERNLDYEEIVRETIEDRANAIMQAMEQAQIINEQFSNSEPVTWRELYNLPAPSAGSAALSLINKEGNSDD